MSVSPSITLNVTLTPELAQLLSGSVCENFSGDQRDRFEVLVADKNPLDEGFRMGMMFYCETTSDTLILKTYEEASGYDTCILWDLSAAEENREHPQAFVVLSSRSWRTYSDKDLKEIRHVPNLSSEEWDSHS